MTTEITTIPSVQNEAVSSPVAMNLFGAEVQAAADMLATSTLIPTTFRGNPANCMIALDMALRIQTSPLMVMQNLYIINGKPSWAATFLIACINKSGLFKTPLQYKLSGQGDDFGCVAWAVDKNGEALESTRVTIKMAKGEGWFHKSGSKWQTMPEQMLKYRSATFFARTYCPELTMGLMTQDEAIDIQAIPPSPNAPVPFTVTETHETVLDVETVLPSVPMDCCPPLASAAVCGLPSVVSKPNPMWNGSAEFPPPEYDKQAEIDNVKRLVNEGYLSKEDIVDALKLYGCDRVSNLADAAFESFVLGHVRLAEQTIDETTKRNIPRAKLNEFARLDNEHSFFVSSIATKQKILSLIMEQTIPQQGN